MNEWATMGILIIAFMIAGIYILAMESRYSKLEDDWWDECVNREEAENDCRDKDITIRQLRQDNSYLTEQVNMIYNVMECQDDMEIIVHKIRILQMQADRNSGGNQILSDIESELCKYKGVSYVAMNTMPQEIHKILLANTVTGGLVEDDENV